MIFNCSFRYGPISNLIDRFDIQRSNTSEILPAFVRGKGRTIFLLGLFIYCSGERRGSGWIDRLGRQDRRRHRSAHTPPSPSIRTYRGLVILPKKYSLCQMLPKEFLEISQILHLRHKFNGKSASLSRWRLLHRRRPVSWREWSRLPGPPSRPIQTISSTLSLVIFSSYARVFSNLQKAQIGSVIRLNN